MRGPSRPVDPRYAPGQPARRGPDRFGMALIGISSVIALLIVLYVVNNRPGTTTSPPAANPPPPVNVDPAAAGTQTAVAFATEVAPLPRVSAQEAIELQKANNATIIDVRPATQYATQHIKAATNIPYTEAATRTKDFPKSGNVILYCQ